MYQIKVQMLRVSTATFRILFVACLVRTAMEPSFVASKCNQYVGVLDRGVLNQLVNLYCVFPIQDGDAKRPKAYTGSGDRCPTSSLRD